ncbi:MAG TPA: ADP-ribosylglycohydrolase family protein [Vicinamibacterales bacterium]|nr:ADP-ribosylglycohydrolase family protein [Vicinamibacterales bacterium]
MTIAVADRVLACLQGIATGDAVGKQTEGLSRDGVQRWYPHGVRGFEGLPGDIIPRYVGNSKREWRIGETTDDTERTLAVAGAILAEREVSHVGVGRAMLRCVKSVHPGGKSLWEFHKAADPTRIATGHDGCGAAIRVAPVGVLYKSDSLNELVSGAREASISTHAGSLAVAAAAATAAAVSAAIDGAAAKDALALAERAAALAESRWPSTSPPAFAAAVRIVHEALESLPDMRAEVVATRCFPSGPLTIVPLALALATLMESAEDAILLAANIGGDTDSVASIAGGILGAMYPATVNRRWCGVVESINRHELAAVALGLAALRH